MPAPGRRLARSPIAMVAALAVGVLGCAAAPPLAPPVTPRPTPDPVRAAAALTNFQERLRSPTLAMHIEQTTSMAAGAASPSAWGRFNYRMDVSGQDFAAIVFVDGKTFELRSVGGTSYSKAGKDPWAPTGLDPELTADVVNPWRCLGVISVLRPVVWTFSPQETFVFANDGPIRYTTSEMRARGIVAEITALRFQVTADGIPVEISFEGSATAPEGTLTVGSTLTATQVGNPVSIQKPVP